MEMTKLNGSTKDSIHNRSRKLGDPGTVQDYESRRMLKRAASGIDKNKRWLYCSFFLEVVVLMAIFASWIVLFQV